MRPRRLAGPAMFLLALVYALWAGPAHAVEPVSVISLDRLEHATSHATPACGRGRASDRARVEGCAVVPCREPASRPFSLPVAPAYWDDDDFGDVAITDYEIAAIVGDVSPGFRVPGWMPLTARLSTGALADAPISTGLIRAPPAL